MNIESSKVNLTEKKETGKINNKPTETSVKFADELSNINPPEEIKPANKTETIIEPTSHAEKSNLSEAEKDSLTYENINANINKIAHQNTSKTKTIDFAKPPISPTENIQEENILNNKTESNKTKTPGIESDVLNKNFMLEKPIENNNIESKEPLLENSTLDNKTELNKIKLEKKEPIIKNIEKKINLKEEAFKTEIELENKKEEKENKKSSHRIKTNIFAKENIHIDKALDNLNSVVKELNQSDDNIVEPIKKEEISTDNSNMINNDFNIQENKELLPQMNPNMNFSGDGQPFSSFMNNEEDNKKEVKAVLRSSAQELAEEAAILSTMAENIAIANKNQIVQPQEVVKTVSREDGIKKVDTKTNITVETVVKYDTIVMNETDVEVFANLVENKEIDIKNITTQATEKSVQISKTLADMLAKAMEKNQPVRIDFDNNISVIIKISRDGKITADFLPSSQVAEAYLKENLPLLRQKFNDNNIEYDSLNQRERKDSNKENNRRKGRNNE